MEHYIEAFRSLPVDPGVLEPKLLRLQQACFKVRWSCVTAWATCNPQAQALRVDDQVVEPDVEAGGQVAAKCDSDSSELHDA